MKIYVVLLFTLNLLIASQKMLNLELESVYRGGHDIDRMSPQWLKY